MTKNSTTSSKSTKGKNHDRLSKLIGPCDKQEDSVARQKLVSARVSLLMHHSFFGNMATRLKLVNSDEWLATAATDGRNFYYNSRFINMLKFGEVQFLFAHEVLHVAYDHIGRRGERNPQLWNIADDYCVNADLKRHSVGKFITTVPCLYSVEYDGKCAEEIYADLLKKSDMIDVDSLVDQMIDDHMEENRDSGAEQLSEEERDQIRQEIRENVVQAAKAAKAAGHSVPQSIERLIMDLTEPQMDWRELIQTVLTSTIKTDYTYMRPSRRSWHMDAILPSQTPGEEIEITVAIDTSGSINNSELTLFLSEIQSIMDTFDGYKIKVLSWDTSVYNPQEYTSENLENIAAYTPKGGGGTDVNCVFNHIKQSGSSVDRLVIFTDGFFFGDYGDPDLCDTLWIIHKNPEFNAPFGEWAHFKE